MELVDFTNALDELGLAWKEAGSSLVVQDCPACGDRRWKVHLRLEREEDDGPFFGRCYAGNCQENYSSIKFLLGHEMEFSEVMTLHGLEPTSSLRGMSVISIEESLAEAAKNPVAKKTVEIDTTKDVDISKFFKLSDWPEHPATQYALSRGAMPSFDSVMIDPVTNAVVFIVREDNRVAGYQRRFVNPVSADRKTKSSFGFQKTQHLLHFPRENAKIVVCEGPFTAIAAWHYGYYAVCTFGSGVSETQLKLIADLSEKLKQPVGVGFDLDEAGQHGMALIRSGMFWKDQEIFRVVADLPGEKIVGFDLSDAFRLKLKVKEVVDVWGGPAIPDIPEFL